MHRAQSISLICTVEDKISGLDNHIGCFPQKDPVPEAWSRSGMAFPDLKWSLFHASAVVCSLLVLLCQYTATGTADSQSLL